MATARVMCSFSFGLFMRIFVSLINIQPEDHLFTSVHEIQKKLSALEANGRREGKIDGGGEEWSEQTTCSGPTPELLTAILASKKACSENRACHYIQLCLSLRRNREQKCHYFHA